MGAWLPAAALKGTIDRADGRHMDVSSASAAATPARTEIEVSVAVLDKALDTARSGASRLLDVLRAADPSKGNRLDVYA